MTMETKDFLFEIGTEEIPARMAPKGAADLERLFLKELRAVRLEAQSVETFVTPRRLVLLAHGLPVGQEDQQLEKRGPAKKIAIDADGNPTRAGEGFARSQGLTLDQLETIDVDGTEYLFARKVERGVQTVELLPAICTSILGAIRFPKSMRWGSLRQTFVRPVHWLLALYGDAVVPFEFAGIAASNTTRAHRFMTSGADIEVNNPDAYTEAMKQGHIVVSPEERKATIKARSAEIAAQMELQLIEDADLLQEVTHLVENPVVAAGQFDEKFLQMPAEVLITSMRYHQKFFAFRKDGKLSNHFLVVNNTVPKDMDVVVAGNRRVLAARLEDALFFFKDDLKQPLEAFVESLAGQTYLKGLGSMKDKTERLVGLAQRIAGKLFPTAVEDAGRAALLCKADLATEMVGEFPELQGVMGREYARHAGENEEVSLAIHQHYLPRFAGDELPAVKVGMAVALADRLDAIVGCYQLGLVPTATKDPYALRRAALAILRILAEKQIHIGLSDLINLALDNYGDIISGDRGKLLSDILAFFKGRLKHWLASSHATELVDACMAAGFEYPEDVLGKVKAVEVLRGRPDYEDLVLPFKRVINITRGHETGTFSLAKTVESAEKVLWDAFLDVRDQVNALLEQKKYDDVLALMLELKPPIDCYFDDVMVMCDDEALKANRLAMVAEIGQLFLQLADFTKILV